MAKLFKVIVELYGLLITSRKDDRSGRVVSTGSLKIDDLIAIAVARRSDINAATMKAVYGILKEIALEEICKARQVEFGLSHYGLKVSGVFTGDHPVWKDGEHRLLLSAVATAEARETVKTVAVEVIGMAASGTYITTLTDVISGETDAVITAGGAVNLAGVKIRIAGNAPGVGLHLTEINSGAVVDIPSTSIAVNEPSRVTFIVPANLPAGNYRLSLVTQFTSNTLLKEPRTYVFECILACNIPTA
ncbi:MAG: DUF4469 domain-containing protein [Tannerella sp.]|jgi:hypothetical protein|nr:DUF4469 domain-containing protein [Tannerella sp.]